MPDTRSTGDDSRSTELGNERAGNPVDQPEVSGESAEKFLYTLPARLTSLRGTPIEIVNEQAPALIELLGNALGIDDYQTNMASFWFLDTMAQQVLKNKEYLDDYCLGVLVSWLAGEMMLIREKKLPREEFFRLMKKIFHSAADKIPDKNRCPYWDEVVAKQPEQTTLEATQSNGDRKESSTEDEKDGSETFISNMDPVAVLDTVMESTYAMYANELRYTLVYEVFAEQITVQSYQVPFSIRKPRPAKLSDHKTTPFNVRLRRTFEMHNVFGIQKKKTGKGKLVVTMVHTPANSLDDEENLLEKRKYILPLIEANETMALFNQHEENDNNK